MYIVTSYQNCSDSGVVPHMLILATDYPLDAIRAAVKTSKDPDQIPFISSILIYRIEADKTYTLSDFSRESSLELLVYKLSKDVQTKSEEDETVWREKFFTDYFKCYKQKKLKTNSKEDEKATQGKFRLVAMFDSDEVWQIYDDMPTREEAYKLYLGLPILSESIVQIFDDKGQPQMKNGTLISLETV